MSNDCESLQRKGGEEGQTIKILNIESNLGLSDVPLLSKFISSSMGGGGPM